MRVLAQRSKCNADGLKNRHLARPETISDMLLETVPGHRCFVAYRCSTGFVVKAEPDISGPQQQSPVWPDADIWRRWRLVIPDILECLI